METIGFKGETEQEAASPAEVVRGFIEARGELAEGSHAVREADLPFTLPSSSGSLRIFERMEFQEGDEEPHEVYDVVEGIMDATVNYWRIDPVSGNILFRRVNDELETDTGWIEADESRSKILNDMLGAVQ